MLRESRSITSQMSTLAMIGSSAHQSVTATSSAPPTMETMIPAIARRRQRWRVPPGERVN
jgi:hypothetical protein